MCDVSDPHILNAYYGITEEEPINWLLLGYKDSKNVITLYASGTHGLSEFRDNLTNEILFGFIRVEDKFVLVTYVPDSVNGVKRARALVHSRSVANVCQLSHAQITASSLGDLSDSNIRTRLKLSPKGNSTNPPQKRRSTQYKRNSLIIQTSEPEVYDIPTSPTFSDTTTVVDSNSASSKDWDDKPKEDASESLFQSQLRKKREMDEARFKDQKGTDPFGKRLSRSPMSLSGVGKPALKPVVEQAVSAEEQTQQTERLAGLTRQTSSPIELNRQASRSVESNRQISKPVELARQTSSPIELNRQALSPVESNRQTPKSVELARQTSNPAQLAKQEAVPVQSTNRTGDLNKISTEAKTVMDGFVSVQNNHIPFWKRRYYIIQDTKTMLIYKDETSIKVPIATIDLLQLTRLEPANEDQDAFVPNSFIINTSSESFQLLADDKKTGRKILETLQGLSKLFY